MVLGFGYLYPAGGALPVSDAVPSVQSVDFDAPVAEAFPVAAVITVQEVDRAIEEAAVEQAVVELLDQAVAFIEPFEGRCYRAYRDSRGHMTIGVGFNLDRAGAEEDIELLLPGVNYRALRRGELTLTDTQIDTLLRHDAQRAIDTARRQVDGFDELPHDAQLIVIDMTYNTGSLHKWRKLRAALARQDYASAADAMHRSLWRKQTGRRAKAHIQMMRDISDS